MKARAVCALGLLLLVTAQEERWPDEDLWYTVRIADSPVGFLHSTLSLEDGVYTSTEGMHVLVHRGDDLSEMQFQTDFVEYSAEAAPADGPRAIRTSYVQEFAKQEIKTLCSFEGGKIHLTSHNGEQEHKTTAPLEEGGWVGRLESRRQFRAGCMAGESSVSYRTVRPELGPKVVTVTSHKVEDETIEIEGVDTPVTVWDVTIEGVPVNMTEVYPTEGEFRCSRLAQMRMQMPFGELRATMSNREQAEAAAVYVADRPRPELVYAMFVPLTRRIRSVNECYEVQIRVKVKDDKQNLVLPSAGYQTVTPVAGADPSRPREVLVSVNLEAPVAATAEEKADEAFLAPSAMIDSSDDFLKKLARKAPGAKSKAKAEQAFGLRDFVYEHIAKKDLTTAFGSASEVARTKEGDCTEHAVLLAALLRTRGIPSRVCHGLVYVERLKEEYERDGAAIAVTPDGHVRRSDGEVDEEGIEAQYGWHMWTQAMINDVWIDLDATLQVPYNVGHILVGTSSMADVEGHYQHMAMAGLIGNLEVSLEKERYEQSESR